MDTRQFHAACGSVHDLRVTCPGDREHRIGDACLPPHETPGEAANPDPALERIREQNRVLHGPDLVNHPPHYTGHPSGVECITVTEWMTFNQGNAVKYLWRMFDKGDPVENLRKAIWYCEREISRLEASGEY